MIPYPRQGSYRGVSVGSMHAPRKLSIQFYPAAIPKEVVIPMLVAIRSL